MGAVCAVFDLDLAAQAVCVRVFVKMIDLLSSPPHNSIPVLLHKPARKQLLCWLMFYGDGSVCVRACMAVCLCECLTHRVCIARSEVKVPLATVWILLS